MSNLVPVDVKELELINRTLQEFINLPTWTPAMAAMLFCGVTPLGRPTQIPLVNNGSLRNRLAPANIDDVSKARRVLGDWVEIRCEEEGETDEDAMSIELNPYAYLTWHVENYENNPNVLPPTWLEYWKAFCNWEYPATHSPWPVPKAIVDKLAALQHAVGSQIAEDPLIHSRALTITAEVTTYRDRVCASIIKNPKSPISSPIIDALRLTDDPKNLDAVWIELCTLAKKKKFSYLTYISEAELEIPHGQNGWRRYKKRALKQYLDRHSS